MSENKPFLVETTPFPNFLLDTIRPRLKGSEWNLLCVIVRQTYGWSDGKGGRKAADWLTHRQLKKRTGLASASICRAIDVLVKNRLVAVSDASGKLLDTPAARRRCGRLYFSLCLGGSHVGYFDTPAKVQKVKTTKETEKIKGFVDFKKNNGIEAGSTNSESVEMLQVASTARQLIRQYNDMFERYTGTPAAPLCQSTLIALCHAINTYDGVDWENLLTVFFDCNYSFIKRRNHSLGAFTDSLHLLQLKLADMGNTKKHRNRLTDIG